MGITQLQLTHDELVKGSYDFRYSVKMYTETYEWLVQNINSTNGWDTIKNAILESHLIHARKLIQFLRAYKKFKTDIIAMDFFCGQSTQFSPFNKEKDKYILNQSKLIGGISMHITSKRKGLKKNLDSWDLAEISNVLTSKIQSFLNCVPETDLTDGLVNDCKGYIVHRPIQITPLTTRLSTG